MMLYASVAMMFVAIVLMAVGYHWKKPAMAIASGMAWILAGLICYGLSAGAWDIYYGFFWFAIGMTIISIMEALIIVRSNRKQAQDDIDTKEEEEESMEGYRNTMQKHRESLGKPKPRKDNYENTGRY